MNHIQTELLDIAFEDSGPKEGSPVLLLHGWPDAPRAWYQITPRLEEQGYRCILPYLRGFKPTRFRSANIPRDGSAVALAQDAIDLADALDLERFAVIGHDWGARTAYTLSALFPERIASLTALSLAFQPRGVNKVPDFTQAKNIWYQWFMCTDGGAEALRRDPIGFARFHWDTWSPSGDPVKWFDDAEFAVTAESFTDPDWVRITLNSYRSRWIPNEPSDPRYDPQRQKVRKVEKLSTPTLMLQGGSDFCASPKESEGFEGFFTSGYERLVIDGVGHFPHREARTPVADAIVNHLSRTFKMTRR